LTIVALAPLDLAALLCSRVCHDVISPVGAIVNGLEVLDGEEDEEMRTIAMDLIKKSAVSASARLQFCRLAFGAAGSLAASIDTGDAESVARGLLVNEKTSLDWRSPRRLLPKNIVKLVLNLCLLGQGCIPRGGVLSVDIEGEGDGPVIRLEAKGQNAKVPHAAARFLSGEAVETIDAHSIQPYYAELLAGQCGLAITASAVPEKVTLTAAPAERSEAEPADAVSLDG
jgi:histidine phosphotransferase ChpT